MRKFKVGKSDTGKRVDVYIAEKLPKFTRSSLKELFENGHISDDKNILKPSHRLSTDEVLSVDTALLTSKPPRINIPVIYEDDDVVVMDKPPGILTHSKGALNNEPTVAGFLTGKLTDKSLSGNRAGIVHRLDRGTSGLIIGAKHASALKHLQRQFSNRQVKKIYKAVVEGRPTPEAAVIDAPIERNPKRPQTFRVSPQGRTAQTEYNVVDTLQKGNKHYSLLELKPVTGRTHQLRVHMAYIGHPLVGDVVYGHDDGPLLLHATGLELNLPDGSRQRFELPMPSSFDEFRS